MPDEGEAQAGDGPEVVRGRPPVLEASPEDFDAKVLAPRGELVVVDFWGPRCPNCEVFAAHRERLLDALAGAAMRLVTVNAYEHPALATRFAVHGIPTFVLVRDGKVLGRMSQFHGEAYWLAVVRERLPEG